VQNGGLRLRIDDMGKFTMVFLELKLQRHGVSRQGMEMAAAITLRTLRTLMHDDFEPSTILNATESPRTRGVAAMCSLRLS
jgi:hypothetical protein